MPENILLSNNARLVLESAYLPVLFDWDRTANDWLNIADSQTDGPIIVKLKNINGNNWDSSQQSNGNAVLITYYDVNSNLLTNSNYLF